MFGYITANREEMKIRDFKRYRSYYCGLCHALADRYGKTGQLTLTYDMTFLVILELMKHQKIRITEAGHGVQQDHGLCGGYEHAPHVL